MTLAWAAVTVAGLLAAAPLGAVEYYRADRFGTPLAPLAGAPGAPGADSGFVLAVESAAEAEAAGLTGLAGRRRLLHDGEQVREWHRIGSVELELEAGKVIVERLHDGRGRLQEERRYNAAGELLQREVLVYRGAGLHQVERYDGAGTLLETERYDLTAGGRLRRFAHLPAPAAGAGGAAGAAAVLDLVFHRGEVIEERHGAAAAELIVRFAGGAEYAREEWADERLLAAHRAAAGPAPATRVDGRAETRSETAYDAAGRPAVVRVYAAGEPDGGAAAPLLEERRYEYHPDGALAALEIAGALGIETYRYTYDGSGRRLREEYRRRGRVQRVTTFPAPGERLDEVYGEDDTVLRVWWRDATRVREEVLRGGEVVRARDLAAAAAGAP